MPQSELELALDALRRGECVGLPTETVYGLAADGTNPSAIGRIFAIKGRPANHPLILHIGQVSWLKRYCVRVPQSAYLLTERFWPGPLTLVLWRADSIPDELTGGLDTVAVRMPAHDVALGVLRALDKPLAAPSANRFGAVSPTCRAHVVGDFGDEVPLVLEGGACAIGVESTILDLTREIPRVLRPGGVTRGELEGVLQCEVAGDDGQGPPAPGTLESHYSPRARVQVLSADRLESTWASLSGDVARVGVMCPSALLSPAFAQSRGRHISWGHTPEAAARSLYRSLRALDEEGCDHILVVAPPVDGIGAALADRLKRASAVNEES